MTLYIELFSIVFLGMIQETLFIPFLPKLFRKFRLEWNKGSRRGFNDGKKTDYFRSFVFLLFCTPFFNRFLVG